MFTDPKNQLRVLPYIAKVLVIDPQPHAGRMMSSVLRSLGPCEAVEAVTLAQGWTLAESASPSLIFVAQETEMDGLAFSRKLRRSQLASREKPLILTISEATAAVILAARDAGVNEIIRKPFTLNDIERRLESLLRARDWIESQAYTGPDRRRRVDAAYAGPRKRQSDKAADKRERLTTQAVQILPLALRLMEGEARQAFDLLAEQARNLAVADGPVGEAAAELGEWLAKDLGVGPLARKQVRSRAEALLEALRAARPQ